MARRGLRNRTTIVIQPAIFTAALGHDSVDQLDLKWGSQVTSQSRAIDHEDTPRGRQGLRSFDHKGRSPKRPHHTINSCLYGSSEAGTSIWQQVRGRCRYHYVVSTTTSVHVKIGRQSPSISLIPCSRSLPPSIRDPLILLGPLLAGALPNAVHPSHTGYSYVSRYDMPIRIAKCQEQGPAGLL